MEIKTLLDEDFVNYKKASMFIGFPYCSFKCDKGYKQQVCQNSALAVSKAIDISVGELVTRYINNPITEAVVCGGLEPFDTYPQLLEFIKELRKQTDDDVVIYTGYYKNEIENYINELSQFKNIVVKFGRYIPNKQERYDEVLGVKLASDNQYAEKIGE